MPAEPRFDVTGLGEVMLRLGVPPGRRLETTGAFDVFPGGCEANVLVALAQLGRRCGWVGALPVSALGRLATREMRRAGVDLQAVAWREDGRVGTYYVEPGVPPRPTTVIYDRSGSCASRLLPAEVDWSYLLDARLLHLSGITPALSAGCADVVREAADRARAAGVAVSLDVNFRRRLWDAPQALATLEPLARQATLLFCTEADAQTLFGLEGSTNEIARALAGRTGARWTVISRGEQGAVAWDGERLWEESARPVQVLDRIGAGDALAAGVIHGSLDGDLSKGLRYGAALAALALTQYGDCVTATAQEVAAMAGGEPEPYWR